MKTLGNGIDSAMVSKTSGVFLAFLFVSGVVGQDGWSVNYTPERICALKGSTVDMSCTYSYPKGHRVKTTVWFILELNNEGEPEDLSENPQYRGRVEYLGNKNHDCRFRITGLRESDSATYRFRFLTNSEGGKYTGQPGVTLTVTGLQVSVNPVTVTVGQRVTLTCRTTCTLSGSPAFIWYKNSKVISNENRMQYKINLASSDDTDLYSCAIKGSENLPSPAVNVKCVRAETDSDTVTEGRWVTLTCRTTCTHPSFSYSFRWYKNGQLQNETSRYLQFTASSERAGRYSCGVWYGSKYLLSPAVTLKVKYAPKGTSVLMKPSGVIKEGSSVTLTCISDANPAVQSYTWYKDNRRIASWTASGQSYTIDSIGYSNAAEYYCETSNVIGEGKSPHVQLKVQCLKVEIAPDTVTEGQSVTLTCRTICAHLRNINYFSWYKNGQYLSNTMQGLQFTASSGDTDSYSCAVYNNKNLISSAVALNLRYAPRNTSASVSPSGEIEEGSSVTLNCSSDANPPVHRYTWFKKNESGVWQTGSGQSLNFFNFRSWNSGQYSCEAQNQHGTHNSTALLLMIIKQGKTGIVSAIVGLAAIVALVFLAVIVWKRRRNSVKEAESREEDKEDNKSPVYDDISEIALSHTAAQDTNRDDDEIALYSTVQPANTSSQEESLYSNVKTLHPKSGHDAQYSSITFSKHSAAPRSSPLKVEDDSVLYSTVAKHNT